MEWFCGRANTRTEPIWNGFVVAQTHGQNQYGMVLWSHGAEPMWNGYVIAWGRTNMEWFCDRMGQNQYGMVL
jgi:hypothetical protein